MSVNDDPISQLLIRYLQSNQPFVSIADTQNETWKAIEQWPYSVSNLGKIKRTGRDPGATVGKIIKGGKSGKVGSQYPNITLCRLANGKREQKTFLLHKVVALAFLGPTPDGMEIDHLDGDRFNCRADNLAFKTPSLNIAGAVERGHHGTNRWNARFTETDIFNIRELKSHGKSAKEIAAIYQCSEGAIHHITSGRSWRHVA